MKRSFVKMGLVFGALFVASHARAEFSIQEMHRASETAVADFLNHQPAHASHFTGYKTWRSKDEAKVKIYVSHHGMNMEFDYACQKSASGVECFAQ